MKTKLTRVLFSALLASGSLGAFAQQLAFPGAQGWGRYATGGRSGSVYHVTNLNDTGTGSLRDAVSQPNRIVVFDVAGVINIKDRIVFAKNLYVAGQTAPGEGVTIYGNGVSFSAADNVIIRYMRFRMGHKGTSGKDAAGIANGRNMIFDHCSFSWGLDETFSINPDGKGSTPQNITISNSIMGQGLLTHSAGGLMQSDSITLYRNLYIDNSTRNNKVKGANQYVNNIVYNWSNAAYIMGGDSEGESFCNIEGNLFINGPSGGGAAFTGGNANFHFYGNDNWQDDNRNGILDPTLVTSYSASDRQNRPYNYPEVEKWAGNSLIDNLLPIVGASLPYRDLADCYMVEEVQSLGKKGGLIGNEETLPIGAPSSWNVWQGNDRIDTDGDGMPDAWEKANGTDPNKNDAMVKAANGYTNIENYINSITADDRDYHLRAPMIVEMESATTTSIRLSWRDYTDGEDGFAIETKQGDGEWKEALRTEANTTTATLTDLEPGTTFQIRIRAFAHMDGETRTSDYSTVVNMSTRPIEVGIIDVDSYQPDLTLNEGDQTWDFTSKAWSGAQDTYADGKKVLLATGGTQTVTLDETVAPESIVAKGDGQITLNGKGAISGDGSVNKTGEGTLTLNTANTYKGATVLHAGILEMNTLKNGGEASSIGTSNSFAQNWIFNGGAYRYTGASTATDRSAQLKSATDFEVANTGTTVTMNGSFEGTADLGIGGKGQVTVNTDKFFAYTGATILRGGTLYLPTVTITKNGIGSSSKLVMAGGTLKTKGETSAYETYSFPIEVTEGTTSQFSPNRLAYIKSKVSGSGNLQINIPYLREYIQGDFSAFTGRLIANGISSESEGSLLLINDNKVDLKKCVVEAKGNARLAIWTTGGNQTLGGLSGTSSTYLSGSSKNTKNFTCTWNVGSANTDETFAGKINNWAAGGSKYKGKVTINKVGTGLWRLTGSNDYSGTTEVKAGTLVVNGSNTGTGAVTVDDGATLKGVGTIAAKVTAKNGAVIAAGDTLVNGQSLKLNGGCVLNEGATLEIPVERTGAAVKSNMVKVAGSLAVNNAILHINVTDDAFLDDDTEISVFNLGSVNAIGNGFATILPEKPSETQVWDTSALLTTGKIYVRNKSVTGINGVTTQPGADDGRKYDLNGRCIAQPQKGDVYIQNGRKIIKR